MRITFSQAIEGYELAAYARRLSPRTLADYNNTFRKLQNHLGDDRPHQGIEQQIPCRPGQLAAPRVNGKVMSYPVLGGLHHNYSWQTPECTYQH